MKSFATSLVPLDLSTRQPPVRKGEFLSINIDDSIHQQGVRELQNSLIGLVLLKSGAKLMPNIELKASLDKIWNIKGDWKFVTLGKGYFSIQFADLRDSGIIFTSQSWPQEIGIIRLQKWVPEFNPYKLKSPIVNFWVRIYKLPME